MMNEISFGWGIRYGLIFIIVVAIVIILLIVLINPKKPHKRLNYKSSMEIRKERFAMSDMRRDEYGEKLKGII